MPPRRGVFEADLRGRKLQLTGATGTIPQWIEVPVRVNWHADHPLSVKLNIRQTGPAPVEWLLSLELLRRAYQVPVGVEVGNGVVRFKREQMDLTISWYQGPRVIASLILQAPAVKYVLDRIGLQPVEEEAAVATAVDILLYDILGPDQTAGGSDG